MTESADQSDTASDRLRAMESLAILDAPPAEALDDLTALAGYICAAPMSVVSFVDSGRQWFTSRYGVDLPGITGEPSLCPPELDADAVLEVPDTRLDERFAGHPMVTGQPGVRFFAAAPLVTAEGQVLGALCVMDFEPRTLSAPQRKHLQVLASQVLSQLELRSQARQLTAEVNARLAINATLRQRQRMLDGVLKYTDVIIFAKDVDGRFVMTNRALDRSVGVAEGELLGLTDYDLFDAEVADEYRRLDAQIMTTREWQIIVEGIPHADGTVPTYRTTKFPLIDDNDEVIGIGGVSTDVTELAAARAGHAEAEERWRALVEQSLAAVFLVDDDGMIIYANQEAIALCGAAASGEIEGRPAGDFVASDGSRVVAEMVSELHSSSPAIRARQGVLRRLDGREVVVEFNATALSHSGTRTVQFELRDITAAAAEQAALAESASTDWLTGLINRRAWDAQVESLRAGTRDRGTTMTIAVVDLDGFKVYNDARGHAAGDTLLKRFVAVAGASLRRDDVFVRWGGDEFLIALPDTTPAEAERVLARILRCVPSGQTCSIGYTVHQPTEPLDDAVDRADQALYEAKARGRNRLWSM